MATDSFLVMVVAFSVVKLRLMQKAAVHGNLNGFPCQ